MSSQIVTFNPGHPVAVSVSEEDAAALGLESGSKLAVSIEPDRIVLKALNSDDPHNRRQTQDESVASHSDPDDPLAGLLRLAQKDGGLEEELYKMRREEEEIRSLAGSLASHPDMVEELQQERRQDKW